MINLFKVNNLQMLGWLLSCAGGIGVFSSPIGHVVAGIGWSTLFFNKYLQHRERRLTIEAMQQPLSECSKEVLEK